jgi:phosphoribosylformylglycinamidine cyclo-ligase
LKKTGKQIKGVLLDYKKAGVDIDSGNLAVKKIKPLAKSTHNSNVLSELGTFGGLFKLQKEKWQKPVLISSTDGVGTKLLVAKAAGVFDTIGADLVNHCVNDIFVHGAAPLFFLDYIGTGQVLPDQIEQIVSGMAGACREHDMALIGGEIAEMPGIYAKDDFDLVGTIVGCADQDNIINGDDIVAGDFIVGFSSSGLHTNGYSLTRAILFDQLNLKIDSIIPEIGRTVGEELLQVHKSYYSLLREFAVPEHIHGMAHITGGGIVGNLQRIIPDGCIAEIEVSSWKVPPLYRYLQTNGKVSEAEMMKTYNMGIGFIAVVPEKSIEKITANEESIVIGRITESSGKNKVVLK